MSASAVVAGASASSCSAAYSRNLGITKSNASIPSPKSSTSPICQRTSFQGLSLQEAKRGVSNSFLAESKRNSTSIGGRSRTLEITARSTAAKNIEVEVDKPLGLTLGPKNGGGVVITVSYFISLQFYTG
uniref:Uncharacterized protein n=1 Tax=Nicotiana tabacum TaxID=4097 RepID=A0A1S3YS55_TOBAC|nr:PREDICTED: uncharacterized protein LOC107779057 [Nicotiana tabacum]